ncbi:MAG: hypothetical protein ACTHKN_26045, partial [Achromobacter mucicolens]
MLRADWGKVRKTFEKFGGKHKPNPKNQLAEQRPKKNRTFDAGARSDQYRLRASPKQGKTMQDKAQDGLTQARTRAARWAAIAAQRVNRGDAAGALLFLLGTTLFAVITVRMMGSSASLSFYDLLR